MPANGLYLVGSVPLPTSEDAFRKVGKRLGTRIGQIPDGEVNERIDWITHLETLFRDNAAFMPSGETFAVHGSSKRRERYKLRPDVNPDTLSLGDLGYFRNALESYGIFRRPKDCGEIEPSVRFQVDLVPAHSVLWLFAIGSQQRDLDPVYNNQLRKEMALIQASIPHTELAIQFDIASAVFARLEHDQPNVYGATKAEMIETFAAIVADLANDVASEARSVFHFCYGDANHKHAVEPTDMGDMVRMANAISAKTTRLIDLIHTPVPRERIDVAYFSPLDNLRLDKRTELNLGLVHYTDGVVGTRKRIDVARKFISSFGIATECGFGRRDPKTLDELLDIHVACDDYIHATSQ